MNSISIATSATTTTTTTGMKKNKEETEEDDEDEEAAIEAAMEQMLDGDRDGSYYVGNDDYEDSCSSAGDQSERSSSESENENA